MIYVIRDALSGHVKIGTSQSPWGRFSKMRTDCPGELSMRALLPGGRDAEQALHRRFAAQRLRGEWFACEGPLAEWLIGLPLPADQGGGLRFTWGDSGLTDDALAPLVGISRAQLCKIRRGKSVPSLTVAVKIADATNVDVRSLLHAQAPVKQRPAA